MKSTRQEEEREIKRKEAKARAGGWLVKYVGERRRKKAQLAACMCRHRLCGSSRLPVYTGYAELEATYTEIELFFCDKSSRQKQVKEERPERGQPGDRGRDRKPKRRLALVHDQQPPNSNQAVVDSILPAATIIVHIIAYAVLLTCIALLLTFDAFYFIMHMPSKYRDYAEQMRHTTAQGKGEQREERRGGPVPRFGSLGIENRAKEAKSRPPCFRDAYAGRGE